MTLILRRARPLNVMARGRDSKTLPTDIFEDLVAQKFKVTDAMQQN